EDVKFSLERYRGASAKSLKENVAAVDTPDPGRVRIRLKQPWPDFMTFYSTATGAGWIVPKKYVEKVGDEGYKKMPVGAGPYRFVSFTPGVELVLEAFDHYWRKTPSVKHLVFKVIPAESGYANGFDAGEYYCDISYANVQEAILNYLQNVGIRAKLRPVERAAFFKEWSEKKYKNLTYGASGAFGNTATRLEAFVVAGGAYVYGSYPDIDGLFREQGAELDRKKREALLHRIQQLVHERVMFIPIWQLAFLNGVGPRVEES